ncbi:MAG: hypothetical protein [Wendovervirus sonii]|uniref:DUF2693 domain-containing protein n=1 Tax=phage Lak_Megaphage_Sonny TaxID=3109229 RepID=A0ABZ0Z4F1_9CAUD|nr:MAG: hypothetical protein [phage Lak_Megaphage_Sonny]
MKNFKFNQKLSKIMSNAWILVRMRKIDMSTAMKMAWKVFHLKEIGSNGTVEFDYVKKSTGELRHAVGTFDTSIMPADASNFTGKANYTPTQIRYFDIEKQAWRSCLMDNLIAIY